MRRAATDAMRQKLQTGRINFEQILDRDNVASLSFRGLARRTELSSGGILQQIAVIG